MRHYATPTQRAKQGYNAEEIEMKKSLQLQGLQIPA